VRDHGFHTVRVRRVVHETEAARSYVLGIPDELRAGFDYAAGQFVTVRAHVAGATKLRCYSMSSAPEVDDELVVTVKRVPGGAVSNWLVDHVTAGDELEVTYPAGSFRLTPTSGALVAFAAGSGITPIMSLLRSALSTTERPVQLFYANQDRASTIFSERLDRLQHDSAGRMVLERHEDVVAGFVDADEVRSFVGTPEPDAEYYVCGPTPFMDIVESALRGLGVEPEHVHVERFAAPPEPIEHASTSDGATSTVVIEIEGRTGTAEHRAGTTILQTARQLGLDPPYSCEAGNCATCMARLLEGTVTMLVNDALTDAEVDDGWVLTCQSVPTSPDVHVVYGYD
jgi:3-ketosteroid 9alpha-monooxygenase subunit B